jgi:hypothetical protein
LLYCFGKSKHSQNRKFFKPKGSIIIMLFKNVKKVTSCLAAAALFSTSGLYAVNAAEYDRVKELLTRLEVDTNEADLLVKQFDGKDIDPRLAYAGVQFYYDTDAKNDELIDEAVAAVLASVAGRKLVRKTAVSVTKR